MSVLLLRLAGPMQAWGTQSRFSIRDTGLEPSKSGVVGLLCAALGKPRHEQPDDGFPALADLADLPLAIRVDRPGHVQADYHTALKVVKASSSPTRRSPDLKPCEPSTRYYLADADFLVALTGPEALLQRLDDALADPVWPLYLGRKAFPPALPVRTRAGVLPGDGTSAALAVLKTQPWYRRFPWEQPPDALRIVAECDSPTAGEVRNDVPLSFAPGRRRFRPRTVEDVEQWDIRAAADQDPTLIQEWPPCSSPN